MLIQTLKELEADGIIERKAMPVIPPHVEYSLTPCGKDLEPVIAEMVKWSLKYNTQVQADLLVENMSLKQ